MRAKLAFKSALSAALGELDLDLPEKLSIEEPRLAAHGDLSTNAAMLLAKKAGKQPRELAAWLGVRLMELCPDLEKVEVAGPGFCNASFKPAFWRRTVSEIEQAGGAYGRSSAGAGHKALVEYVSANPTGPLHVGHGRGAAIGDSVARLLRCAGYEVATEYYLNDAGRQMRILGLSIWLRLRQRLGENVDFPGDCYKGEYIKELAAQVLEQKPELAEMEAAEGQSICQDFGMREILAEIKSVLAEFRCEHQTFFSEKSLVESGAVRETFQSLEKSGRSFESDGAIWFDAISLGDDRNRVLRKSDGSLTYFATDIAYHHDKFQRGFDWLIDVWGADHHGYIPRMRAAIQDMGQNPDRFSVLLIQLVNLLRNGEAAAMSTRAGEFVTLEEVIREVGVDAARFLFLSRSSDTPLDFDLELAKQRGMDNPVYYVQYAHARVCALLRRAREKGMPVPRISEESVLAFLDAPEEIEILRQLDAFDGVIMDAAKNLAPHHVSRYLSDLAAKLHSYYAKYQIILPDDELTSLARLAFSRAVGQVLANGLFLLGVTAPESM